MRQFKTLLAPDLSLSHINPEMLARHVDGRDIPVQDLTHLVGCELCRARASDARLLRALLADGSKATATSRVPLDASTLAGYHDQALVSEQMAAVDRRMLRDDSAVLELIELRLGLHVAQRADAPDSQFVARIATAFSTGQTEQTQRVASLGTIIIDRDSQIPVFHFHAATPEDLAGANNSSRSRTEPQVNDSGSYPAPAPRRELALHAGRHTLRVRMAPNQRLELFLFDEQHFRPANGIGLRLDPDQGESQTRTTNQTGFAAFDLSPCHARLLIDAGDRWVLELR